MTSRKLDTECEPMKISEYIQNEKTKMKEKSRKERLAYFWDYYKWYVIIGLLALVLLGQTVSTVVNRKEIVLEGILLDAVAPPDTPAIMQEFYAQNDIDPAKQEIYLNTGLALDTGIPSVVATTYQRLHAGIGAKHVDFIVAYEYATQRLAYDTSCPLADLRDILSAEDLEKLEGRIYYVDESVIQKIRQNPHQEIPLPDPNKPEEMENPVPVAVDIGGHSGFTSLYYAADKPVYIAAVTNTLNQDLVTRFIEFLLS